MECGQEVVDDVWRDTYERRKAAWKLEARQTEMDENLPINSAADLDMMSVDIPLVDRVVGDT